MTLSQIELITAMECEHERPERTVRETEQIGCTQTAPTMPPQSQSDCHLLSREDAVVNLDQYVLC